MPVFVRGEQVKWTPALHNRREYAVREPGTVFERAWGLARDCPDMLCECARTIAGAWHCAAGGPREAVRREACGLPARFWSLTADGATVRVANGGLFLGLGIRCRAACLPSEPAGGGRRLSSRSGSARLTDAGACRLLFLSLWWMGAGRLRDLSLSHCHLRGMLAHRGCRWQRAAPRMLRSRVAWCCDRRPQRLA